MIKRLPESWIPPDHILDLRARVRLLLKRSYQTLRELGEEALAPA